MQRQEPHISLLFITLISLLAATTGACTHTAITPESSDPAIPAEWARGGDEGSANLNWLDSFNDSQLSALVAEAVSSNYVLAQERARYRQAEQTVVITRANRFPDLAVSLNGSRRASNNFAQQRFTNQNLDISVDARWDADLWGRLRKQQQSAQLALSAQEARVLSVERNLAAATATGYYTVIEATQLLAVAVRRLDNAVESQDIVASGYRQGLNDALDLYLARNQVERQKASLAQQEQTLAESIAALQLSLARYPDGRMEIQEELPDLLEPIPAGLPSELLTRRSDVQEAWLNLLAADADLAAAHKARFPSLSLVGSSGIQSPEFSELLDTENSIWSIAGGLTQPLFNAGRLESQENQAAARVEQVEQQYLDLVFSAFADVENSISRAASLRDRYDSFVEAEKNSAAALNLALEQYQRGLVPYTTVLESQRQAFDAEVTVVQLKNQLIQNRISLHLSLGGEFSTE